MSKKVLIVTDAWVPQINGVVRVLEKTVEILKKRGFDVHVFHPHMFKTITFPGYRDIPITYGHLTKIGKMIKALNPDYIHIATEGSLGNAARRYCVKHNIDFTTAYHTRYPEYARERFHIPLWLGFRYMKWFHSKARCVLVVSDIIRKELETRGFTNVVPWSLGVDTDLFSPTKRDGSFNYRYVLYVGRVTPEKNIRAFLDLELFVIDSRLQKVVVGDGKELEILKAEYPEAIFVGAKEGEELARYYANAEVFCFPSKTETFGLVMLEALACGVPVAAYDVPQIMEVITHEVGATSTSLLRAIEQALKNKNPDACRVYVVDNFSWSKSIDVFIKNM